MKDIFEKYVEQSFGETKQAVFKFRQFEYNYRKYFPSDAYGARLLDVGIGRGEMLACMRDWGYKNYFGIDISPSTINFCRSLGLPCELIEDTRGYLLKHSASFDVITLLDVLEHIPKKEIVQFLISLRLALKPGGILIVQVPNLQAPDGHLHRYNDITHEIGFVEHSFSQVLLAAGFTNFSFVAFEDFVFGTPFEKLKKTLRALHWAIVRLFRRVDGNLNPKILSPVFSAVCAVGVANTKIPRVG